MGSAELFAPIAEILAEPVIRQMALTGTGGFDIILDMLKDVIDHHLPVQNILAAHTDYGVATPGSMMPYNPSSPMYDEAFKGSAVAFSPLAQSGEDDPAGFTLYLPGFSQSPFGAGLGSTCNFTFSHSALCNLTFLQSISWCQNITNTANAQSGTTGESSLHPHFSNLHPNKPTVQPSALSFSPTS
ncbi:hypothetical protein BS47DRAFT_1399867 [Hydnum rufescens UP504]|uniref:Uncharacterized protein n=1 Tax=Hydnum rufescens UP504 TaxID=1448309 RepID=A0A9P6DP85_9AGAM|nr:hypothetical protein BS47DRAFT_1399867 [Hydnum rufescens UP504]